MDLLHSLIDNSSMNAIHKTRCRKIVNIGTDNINNKSFVERVINQKIDELVISTNELNLYKIGDEYNFIFLSDDKWKESGFVNMPFDQMLLIYLQLKYLNESSDFGMFAMKMLDMKFNDGSEEL